MSISVLVLGDELDWEAYNRFCKQLQNQYHSKKLNWITSTYNLLDKDKLPVINSDILIIYLFFPFTYWDKHIEKEGYRECIWNCRFL